MARVVVCTVARPLVRIGAGRVRLLLPFMGWRCSLFCMSAAMVWQMHTILGLSEASWL